MRWRTDKSNHEIPKLSDDLFRHAPLTVRLESPDFGRYSGTDFRTRHVRSRAMILEAAPPLHSDHPFDFHASLDLSLRLPFVDSPLRLRGTVIRVIPLAEEPSGGLISVIGLRLEDPDPATQQLLASHEVRVRAEAGEYRAARIPVRFPLEFSDIDVGRSLQAFDLSMTGMFVVSGARVPVDKVMRIRFQLPFQRREITVTGRVVWTGRKIPKGRLEALEGFGVQFVEVPAESLAALAAYYSRNTLLL